MTSTVDQHNSTADTDEDWLACKRCQVMLYRKKFERLSCVCPECGWHAPLTANGWLDALLDDGSAKPIEPQPSVHDPLSFVDLVPYESRLRKARASTGMDDAVLVTHGELHGAPVVIAAMDFRFLGGSLGTAAGEAIVTAAEAALTENAPLLLITASGGARMQEGVLSLMQMAKTSNAMAALDAAGLLTVTLVTDPTYGGVAASYATLSDVIIAEPGARMGFAGPRVIEQTIRQRLKEGFQTAEFLLDHGLVDEVRSRADLPYALATLTATTLRPGRHWGRDTVDPILRDPELVEVRPVDQVLSLSRHLDRPTTLDHIRHWTEGFIELHGDRMGADCPSIVGGIGLLDGQPIMFVGHQKGHTTAELVMRGFGMPSPSGYRKAIRLMKLADKLRIPVVTLVDTPGAYPGPTAEEGGQAHAIAESLRTMGNLRVPVVTVITGEGGSGGALALAIADRVLVCQNATYSVISPEGCAAILWRDAGEATTAAAALRVDARSLLRQGIVDGVVPEPEGGAHTDPTRASGIVRDAVVSTLRELREHTARELTSTRHERFRRFGAQQS